MDTWTYMEDMHHPIAPGSYQFKKGYASKVAPKNKTSFNLVCIRTGVKAPLLSDLSHRAKIRYGLDVVMQRQAAAPSPKEYIHHTEYVPPPTAEAMSVGRADKSSYSKYALSKNRSMNINFDKLQTYQWTAIENKKKTIPRAPDLLYRNTFGENNQSNSNMLTPRPEIRAFGESPRSPSPKRTTGGVSSRMATTNASRSLQVSRMGSPPRGSVGSVLSRPVSEGSMRPVTRPDTRQARTLSGRRLLKSLTDMSDLQPNVKPLSAGSALDQRQGLNGSSGCLFSQVKQSIKFIRHVENGEPIDVPRLVRPLVTENGRYRPHSKTKIATPRTQSPITREVRNHKSADAYLKIISPPKIAETKSRGYGGNTMGSPSMTEIIQQYMTSHERYNTPTSVLQHVTDVNRPTSRTSTRQSVRFEMIPAWARTETRQTDYTESEGDALSRVASRVGITADIPEVTFGQDDEGGENEEESEVDGNGTEADGSKPEVTENGTDRDENAPEISQLKEPSS